MARSDDVLLPADAWGLRNVRSVILSFPSPEHLTPAEVERLIIAASKVGRHGLRDAALILVTYRHMHLSYAGVIACELPSKMDDHGIARLE